MRSQVLVVRKPWYVLFSIRFNGESGKSCEDLRALSNDSCVCCALFLSFAAASSRLF